MTCGGSAVQVRYRPPKTKNPNYTPFGDGFGFFAFLDDLGEYAGATALLISGKLDSYLQELDKQADDMFERLVAQFVEQEGITEKLKAENQLEWVRRMNGICEGVTEIVNRELIYN